jgi:hypothetical protein
MKKLIGNVRGPQGDQGDAGPKGDPGDITQLGDLETIADVVASRVTDIPDLSLIFENSLI